MADAEDSKSSVGNHVRVQVPPSAPLKNESFLASRVRAIGDWTQLDSHV